MGSSSFFNVHAVLKKRQWQNYATLPHKYPQKLCRFFLQIFAKKAKIFHNMQKRDILYNIFALAGQYILANFCEKVYLGPNLLNKILAIIFVKTDNVNYVRVSPIGCSNTVVAPDWSGLKLIKYIVLEYLLLAVQILCRLLIG
jgi:hypothetical protein